MSRKTKTSRRDQNKTPLALAAIIVALILAPSTIYAIMLARAAVDEGQNFANAPLLGTERVQDKLYRFDGTITAGLLTPPGFPGLSNALRFTVRQSDGHAESGHTEKIEIGDVPVKVEAFSRIHGEHRSETRTTPEGLTILAEATIIPNGEAVVWGVYDQGMLRGGRFDRLTITTKAGAQNTLTDIAERGAAKAKILIVAAAIGTMIILGCAIFAWRILGRGARPRTKSNASHLPHSYQRS